jgi:hypothetical protein
MKKAIETCRARKKSALKEIAYSRTNEAWDRKNEDVEHVLFSKTIGFARTKVHTTWNNIAQINCGTLI